MVGKADPVSLAFRAAVVTAFATAALVTAARAELLDLLRPGSRPATGLAGDPFRSPFSGGDSWAQRVLEGRPGMRAEAVSSRTLDRHGLPADLRSSRVDWIASGAPPVPGPPWTVAARLTRPEFEASWDGRSSGARLDGVARGVDVAVEAPRLLDRARVRAVMPVTRGSGGAARSPVAVELAWLGSPRLALQGGASWSRAPARVRASTEGEDFEAPLNAGLRRYQGDLWSELVPGVAIEASVSDAEIAPLEGRRVELAYQLEPAGTIRLLRGGAVWRLPFGPRLLLRRTDLRVRLEADASWGGQRFGNLNYANVDATSWLGGIQWPLRRGRALLDFESASGALQSRADVESWPFTDALADLLGARRIARGTGSLRWEVAHAALERGLYGAARVRAGLAWYDLRPEAALESWRPVFLVFGRTDEERHVLRVRRLQLGEVALGADLRLAGLELDLRQVVFARVRRGASAPSASPGGTGGAEGGAASSGSRALAGSRVELRIERPF